jgi:hypothetical protein
MSKIGELVVCNSKSRWAVGGKTVTGPIYGTVCRIRGIENHGDIRSYYFEEYPVYSFPDYFFREFIPEHRGMEVLRAHLQYPQSYVVDDGIERSSFMEKRV